VARRKKGGIKERNKKEKGSKKIRKRELGKIRKKEGEKR